MDYEGKHYTLYEAGQPQRRLETSIRNRKHRILIDEQLGDKGALQNDQIRLQLLKQEYTRFSKAAKLPMQYERMEIAGFDWKKGKAAEKTVARVEREKAAEKARLAAEAASKESAADAPAESTPTTNLISGNRSYVDITGAWYPDAKPNSHPVVDLQEYVVDGVTYKVDGRNVQLDYKPHEKEIAELLEREIGGEIFMVPRVNNPQGVKTPDFLFHGKGYDLKTLHNPKGKNPIFNRIQNAKGQSKNFILDLTDAGLDEDFIQKQLEKVFSDKSTEFVDEVVVIRNGRIEKVLKRQKKS